MELSFIIVNYRSRSDLKKCLASISSNVKNVDFEVIIVNNEKDKLSESKLNPSVFFDVHIVEMGENVGFGRACNAGAKNANGDILCFLNPDVLIVSSKIEKLVNEMKKHENIGIIGPRILEKNGKIQPWSTGREPRVLDLILNHQRFIRNKKIWECNEKRCVDWVTGAALFVKKEVFKEIKGFDEKLFLYFEDVDLCKRVTLLGKKVVHFPDFLVEHKGGGSVTSGSEQKKAYYESQDYYFQKHFGSRSNFLLKVLRAVYLWWRRVANKAE